VEVQKFKNKLKSFRRISGSEIFGIAPAMALYRSGQIQLYSMSNKLSRGMHVFGLSFYYCKKT